MRSAEDLALWQRLDDVIMGGQSSSGLAPAADGSGVVWTGAAGRCGPHYGTGACEGKGWALASCDEHRAALALQTLL